MKPGRRATGALVPLLVALGTLPGGAVAGPDAAREGELLNLLRHDCGSCHGLRLEGGLGPSLTVASLSGKPSGLLIDVIRNGRAGTAMPPWQGMLQDEEIAWLVDQLLTGVHADD
ncbi:MAG: cytochrome c [Gammaproteobacteria bacterium]|nr:cytochrome c [Gammaproteobacteria bacterium]